MIGGLQVVGGRKKCLGSGGYLARGLTKFEALLNIAGAVNLGLGTIKGEASKDGIYASAGGATLFTLVCMTAVPGDIINNVVPVGPLYGIPGGVGRGIVTNVSRQYDFTGNNPDVLRGLDSASVNF